MGLTNKLHGFKSICYFDNRLPLIISRLLYRSNPINIYKKGGKYILIDHNDINGTREAIISPIYRGFLSGMRFRGEINVIDIGANGGGFPLMLALNQIKIRKLVCAELNPNTYLRLQFNIGYNFVCEYWGFNVAVCGEDKDLQLYLGKGGTTDNIYNNGDTEGARLYNIKGITLDEVYNRTLRDDTIDICKIDIEGAEYEIFESPHRQCLNNCRYLIIEIHDREDKDKYILLNKIHDQGFKQLNCVKSGYHDVYMFESD